ncbi:MAG: hypothetical protein IJR33_09690 [Clostridia bacterium]|nr:hypothetical protein [Clostridia bacterium]
MKKIIALALSAIILTAYLPAYSASSDFPHSFWAVDDKYQAAKNAGDYNNVIWYGKQSIDICLSMSDGNTKREVLTSRYDEIGNAYYELGDYDSSAEIYRTLYEYENTLGPEYAERAKIAYIKSTQYPSEMSVYTDSGDFTDYKAKNEKANGVLFGLCSNGETRSKLGNESMVLVYQELGQPLLPYNTNVVRQAGNDGIAVELALNCPNHAADIRRITSMDSYLDEISDMLSSYSNIPVYLRFAAEFDVWPEVPSPDEFKTAFRYVANYFKSHNQNVAMVWSPNQASNWNVNIDDYYPGDQYVDWVGISSYAKKYSSVGGDDEEQSLFFENGINSEPVVTIRDIVEKYGDRKPIMLSESGCGHHIMQNGRSAEDTTDFAIRRMREYLGYLPMVYPQVKLIAYFDHYVEGSGETNDFRLSNNTELQNEYLRLTKGARFIQDKYANEAPLTYRQIHDGRHLGSTFLLSCYARKYGNETQQVTYYIDDKYVGMSKEIPFEVYVDGTDLAGDRTLKTIAHFADGTEMVQEYAINIADKGGSISVDVNGNGLDFDQQPVIYNNRTMVPMRKIFESLGADVSWDADTRAVSGTRGDRTVKIAIGDRKMYINHKEVLLDTAPIILGARTLVPVRAVAEGMGCNVDWNGAERLVDVTQRVFTWSDWDTSLPAEVDEDLFYIEKKEQYRTRTRTRDKEYYSLDYASALDNYIDTDISYGKWSSWQEDYISSSNSREVDTRTVSEPVTYTYYHYCTGYNDDESLSYRTAPRSFSDLCSYHVLGTFDYRLGEVEDGNGGKVLYDDDGSYFYCSNSCYRWYETVRGGSHTEYRSRSVSYKYNYWRWGDWSGWSGWSDWRDGTYNPSDWYSGNGDTDTGGESRTVYRYKEK